MLIECLRRRTKGTVVSIGDAVYTFIPLPDGAHVCDVTHPDHIKRLLMIEAYVPYGPAATGAPVEEAPPPANVQPPRDLTIDPALFLGLPAARAAEPDAAVQAAIHDAATTGTGFLQTEVVDDAVVVAAIATDDVVPEVEPDPDTPPDYATLTDAELAEAYEARFDKLPHNRMKRETIIGHLTKED